MRARKETFRWVVQEKPVWGGGISAEIGRRSSSDVQRTGTVPDTGSKDKALRQATPGAPDGSTVTPP